MDNKNLMKALAAFNAENISVKRDRTNPHFKNKYATLDEILDTVRPLLFKHGLVVWFEIKEQKIHTFLAHCDSGEFFKSEIEIPQGLSPQQLGSHITYMKRYSIGAMLSLATEDDDDANEAESNKTAKPAKPASKPAENTSNGKVIGDKDRAMILAQELAKKVKDITDKQEFATQCKLMLEKYAKNYADYKTWEEFITTEANKILNK